MEWYFKVLGKYADFSGRARRSEYWYFVLFNLLISLALMVADLQLKTFDKQSGFGMLGGIYSLLVLLPGLGVMVRRLHDIGKSGWTFLLILIPLAGGIILLVFLCRDSDRGENQYGPNPKGRRKRRSREEEDPFDD